MWVYQQTANMEGFPAETSEDDITLSQFLNTIESEKNDTRSAEYSENIGLSFENMRNKWPFGNNTFENCTFNFNSKNQFGLTEHISNIKFVYLQGKYF